MITRDQFWSAYAKLQEVLSGISKITPKTVALEESLTKLLADIDALTRPNATEDINQAVNRSLNTCAWRERSHVRIRARHSRSLTPHVSAEMGPIAVVEMHELRDRLTPYEWSLLFAVAAGFTYDELSTSKDSAMSLRVKVYRARKKAKESV